MKLQAMLRTVVRQTMLVAIFREPFGAHRYVATVGDARDYDGAPFRGLRPRQSSSRALLLRALSLLLPEI